ncbi:hypothetical protein CARUB_v10016166mg [Capsella rubella]|uniref:Uncharacterized protein n=2 Tax=Capsella rubella TaxID=81985 RepID=R0GB85_9BRAS|nr:hypothetical protein CARUB_v10016166mg [Capsella rubella]
MHEKPQSPSASDVATATAKTTKASSEKEDKKKKTVSAASLVAEAKTKKTKKAKKKQVCVSGEAKKRASEEETSTKDVSAAKRAKKDVKKPNNQRLWSEEDEIRVLQGIVDFKSKTGKKATEDKSGFYEFIKDSISVEVSLSQCIEKIKTVKRKFMNKRKKGKKPEAHNLKSFELSEMIWGSDDAEESRKNEMIKRPEEEEGKDVVILEQIQDWFNNSFLFRQVASFGVDEDSLKRRWSSVDTEKKKMVEDKLRVLQTKELGLVSQKTELLYEVASLIAEEN